MSWTQSALEGGILVAEVKVGKNESLDNALRRFKRHVRMSGVLSEARKREHYEKPSVRRKRNPRQPVRESTGKSIWLDVAQNDIGPFF